MGNRPRNKHELKMLICKYVDMYGVNCNLNHIDTSLITDMSRLFYGTSFNGNISTWDVSNVLYMDYMFSYSLFNGDISRWNTTSLQSDVNMYKNSSVDENNKPLGIMRTIYFHLNTIDIDIDNSSILINDLEMYKYMRVNKTLNLYNIHTNLTNVLDFNKLYVCRGSTENKFKEIVFIVNENKKYRCSYVKKPYCKKILHDFDTNKKISHIHSLKKLFLEKLIFDY